MGLSTAMELRALLLLLLCFPGLQAQTPAEERRREGATLHVQCPYTAKANQRWKAWCLWKSDPACWYSYTGQSTDGKVTINDDPTARTMSVTMKDLKTEDSGTYCCIQNDRAPLKIISLNVFKEVLQWELDILVVQCPYNSRGGYTTTWCRRGETECGVIASTDGRLTRGQSKALRGGTSIKYHGQLQTVTMEKLQAQDTGVYWCAFDHGRIRTMEVVLSVSKRTQQYTAKESGNVSVQCQYKNTNYGTVSKAWCKEGVGTPCEILVTTSSEPSGDHRTPEDGRVRIQDDSQQGIVTVTMEQLQAQDSGVYWCALHEPSGLSRMEEITLTVSQGQAGTALSDTEATSQATSSDSSPAPSSNMNTFILLTVILSILLVLAVVTSVTLCARLHRLLQRAGNREAEDTYGSSQGTAQLGSTGRRERFKDVGRGLKYIKQDLQSQPSPGDPLYSNIEPNHWNPRGENVEYAVIAFSQVPRNDTG